MSELDLKIKYVSDKIGNSIAAPFYATDGAAGMDLSSCADEPITLGPSESFVFPTGIAIGLPSNLYVALVFARSGLGIKHGITLTNGVGVIDSDYRGEIKCGLVNLGKMEYTINPGDRIAQLIVMPVVRANLTQVENLNITERGEGGLGSTGK